MLFLLGIIPASLFVERLIGGPAGPRPQSTIRQRVIGLLLLLACSLVPAGVYAGVLYWDAVPQHDLYYVPMLIFVVWASFEWGTPSFVPPLQFLIAPLSFVVLHAYLAGGSWPRPIPLRVPCVMALFTVLNLAYLALDGSATLSDRGLLAVGVYCANALSLAGLWLYWLRIRLHARRYQAVALAIGLHCWLLVIAFPEMGGDVTNVLFEYLFPPFHYGRLVPP